VTGPSASPDLTLEVAYYTSGSVRVQLTEDEKRWEPEGIILAAGTMPGRFDLLSKGDARLPMALQGLAEGECVALGLSGTSVLAIHMSPLKFELFTDNVLQISANDRDLLHYEWKQSGDGVKKHVHVEEKDRHGGKKVVGYWEDGLAIYEDGSREAKEETKVTEAGVDVDGSRIGDKKKDEHENWTERFGAHVDTRPDGPMSVGMDFSFPFAEDVYGIPEHTSPLSLPTSQVGSAGKAAKYSEPYRLYNLDVFEYELDNTMALYGHIPFLMAHGIPKGAQKAMTAALYWHNPSETFIDIVDGGSSDAPHKQSRWLSETGNVDFFFMPGPTMESVYEQYTKVVGTQALPPMFSLGYHQCRWNYRDERDVAAVEQTFEDLDFPVDVIWLDIEHTDGKRYFTWDKNVFPNPIEMQKNVSAHGRKMVTIVDPHIKRDNEYPIHTEATSKGLYIKDKNGADYDGYCWPGQSSYLDFTDSNVRDWWASKFALDQYKGSTLDLFTWNDMNEPSVFNGPEVSMQKDSKNIAGVEHRYWHNLYGLYMQRATAEGLTKRSPKNAAPLRPFVLSRAFYTGSQRYGAIWTGDNTAEWGHLKIASPMLLSINLAGLSFAGADVGGFFGDPSPELMTRWFQAGAFTPFFRGHAHHDTKRREPWVHGEEHTAVRRKAAMLRYSLLPLWYTVFFQAYSSGMPVMRPMFMTFPDDSQCFKMDDQWMVGDALLVKPVTSEGENHVSMYLPKGSGPWFDLETLVPIPQSSTGRGESVRIEALLDKIPVLIRGGAIVPRKMRLRRAASLMLHDPFTLFVAPSSEASASGSLYLDDEKTMAHEKSGEGRENFVLRNFTFVNGSLKSTASNPDAVPAHTPANMVERVVLMGQAKAAKEVVLVSGDTRVILESSFDASAGTITVKRPNVLVAADWEIKVAY
jgi:alpha 1,3-glucosidase